MRVYGGDRLRRDRLIGEKLIAFSSLEFDELQQGQGQSQGKEQGQGRGRSLEHLVKLEPRSNIEVTLTIHFVRKIYSGVQGYLSPKTKT